MRSHFFYIIPCIIVFAVLFIFPAPIIHLQAFLRSRAAGGADSRTRALEIENQILRGQLTRFESVKDSLPDLGASVISAFAYSRFPFNFKNEITVAAGSDDGVRAGAGVLLARPGDHSQSTVASNAILLGIVSSASAHSSVVMTIFDSRWKSEVRVGGSGTQALLAGGLEPKLSFIPKTASVAPGDQIYSTDARFGYGLIVGEVREVFPARDSTFQEATVKFVYDPASVEVVSISRLP